jgi:hypothetical protein
MGQTFKVINAVTFHFSFTSSLPPIHSHILMPSHTVSHLLSSLFLIHSDSLSYSITRLLTYPSQSPSLTFFFFDIFVSLLWQGTCLKNVYRKEKSSGWKNVPWPRFWAKKLHVFDDVISCYLASYEWAVWKDMRKKWKKLKKYEKSMKERWKNMKEYERKMKEYE